jgi:hypothetical protein
MLDAFVRCSRIHTAASCRNVRILVYVIASRGWPKPSPLRHFTSQKSISASRQRQFRSSICMPCRSNSAQAKSSPRTPNCFFGSVAGMAHDYSWRLGGWAGHEPRLITIRKTVL